MRRHSNRCSSAADSVETLDDLDLSPVIEWELPALQNAVLWEYARESARIIEAVSDLSLLVRHSCGTDRRAIEEFLDRLRVTHAFNMDEEEAASRVHELDSITGIKEWGVLLSPHFPRTCVADLAESELAPAQPRWPTIVRGRVIRAEARVIPATRSLSLSVSPFVEPASIDGRSISPVIIGEALRESFVKLGMASDDRWHGHCAVCVLIPPDLLLSDINQATSDVQECAFRLLWGKDDEGKTSKRREDFLLHALARPDTFSGEARALAFGKRGSCVGMLIQGQLAETRISCAIVPLGSLREIKECIAIVLPANDWAFFDSNTRACLEKGIRTSLGLAAQQVGPRKRSSLKGLDKSDCLQYLKRLTTLRIACYLDDLDALAIKEAMDASIAANPKLRYLLPSWTRPQTYRQEAIRSTENFSELFPGLKGSWAEAMPRCAVPDKDGKRLKFRIGGSKKPFTKLDLVGDKHIHQERRRAAGRSL